MADDAVTQPDRPPAPPPASLGDRALGQLVDGLIMLGLFVLVGVGPVSGGTTPSPFRISCRSSNTVTRAAALLDGVNKKKRLVVTDAKGNPIGTDIGQSFRVKPNESDAAWAKVPAPAANVDRITVVIAKTPPFEDVPIAK